MKSLYKETPPVTQEALNHSLAELYVVMQRHIPITELPLYVLVHEHTGRMPHIDLNHNLDVFFDFLSCEFEVETNDNLILYRQYLVDPEYCPPGKQYALDFLPDKFLIYSIVKFEQTPRPILLRVDKKYYGQDAKYPNARAFEVSTTVPVVRGSDIRVAFAKSGFILCDKEFYLAHEIDESISDVVRKVMRVGCFTALACVNQLQAAFMGIGSVKVHTPTPKSAATTTRRTAKGKKPLFDFTNVQLVAPKRIRQRTAPTGTHASPRQHERRGHWRLYQSGKRIWIEKMVVGSKDNGVVKQIYVA